MTEPPENDPGAPTSASAPPPEAAPEEHHRLSKDLRELLANTGEEGLTIADLMAKLQDRGFGLVLVFLSLPSALPVPAPGYSTPFGIALVLLTVQMLFGRTTPWLPRFVLKMRIGPKLANTMIGAAAAFFAKVEWLIKPRLGALAGGLGERLAALIIIIMSCLMILPIPFTNTFPAMVVFIIGVALIEKDGLLMLLSLLLGALAVALYAYVVYLVVTLGTAAAEQLKEQVKGWITGEEAAPVAPGPDAG
ncbi:MAG: exopolysaccharide biosynthesis protein [Verrucomicrobiota bacterium]